MLLNHQKSRVIKNVVIGLIHGWDKAYIWANLKDTAIFLNWDIKSIRDFFETVYLYYYQNTDKTRNQFLKYNNLK